MNMRSPRIITSVVTVALAALTAGCASSSAQQSNLPVFVMGQEGAIARARADSLRYPYTKADIDFMSGMIHHHAQAITISRWTASHGADAAVHRLAERIINAQGDEITLMQMWLRDRNQSPPLVDSTGKVTMPAMPGHEGHDMGGHSVNMPGMLTDAQLKELDAARGKEFDRLFLTFMIAHHKGAITMVKTLFSSPGAGQDETVFKFANDVEVDQSTEIKRMGTMMLEFGLTPPPAE